MSTYVFRLDGTPVCDIGLESMALSLRASGPDSLTWAYAAVPTGTPPHAVHDEVTVTCQTFDDDGVLVSTETLFHGRVVQRTAADASTGGGWTYAAANAWADMRRIVLTQSWKSWDPDTSTLVNRDVPRVVLGIDSAGAAVDTGDILAEIIGYASTNGALVTAGTLSPALIIPPTELVDTVCDAALRQILAYHPDHIAWIEDGQTLHIRPPSALTSLTVDPCADALDIEHDPQTDEIPGGVVIVWERTHTLDGIPRIERIHQSAGSSSGWPPPIYMTIPLRGTAVTTKTQLIETRTLPVVGETSAAAAKNFIKGLFPSLENADNDDLRIASYSVAFANPKLDELDEDGETVNPNSRPIDRGSDVVTDFPRMLTNGQVQPWMPATLKQYDAILKAKIHYSGTDPVYLSIVQSGIEIEQAIVVTNALPKLYSTIDGIEGGEEPIAGLATSYWTAINQTRNEGTVRGDLAGQWIDLRPGRKVIVTGYFDTAAPIVSADLNLIDHTFTARYGSSEYLNPKTIVDLARTMAKNEPRWTRPEERTQASANGSSSGPIQEGAKQSPQYPPMTKAPRKPWDLEVIDFETGEVKIHVGTIIKNMADLTVKLDIADYDSTFTPTAGQTIRLKLTGPYDTPVCTLQAGGDWTDYPAPVETTGEGLTAVFAAYYFPLWEITSTAAVDTIPIKENRYARKLVGDYDLVRSASGYHKTGDLPFAVPFLWPYHRSLA